MLKSISCLVSGQEWFTFQLSPNLTSSLNKLEDPPNLPNLGVGVKAIKDPGDRESPNARAGQAHSLRVMWLGPITDAEQMPTCSCWTWPTIGHTGSTWGALIRPLHLSPREAKAWGSQERQHSSRFHSIPSLARLENGVMIKLPVFSSYSVIAHTQWLVLSRLTNLTSNALM